MVEVNLFVGSILQQRVRRVGQVCDRLDDLAAVIAREFVEKFFKQRLDVFIFVIKNAVKVEVIILSGSIEIKSEKYNHSGQDMMQVR